jgi:hypothetical protein
LFGIGKIRKRKGKSAKGRGMADWIWEKEVCSFDKMEDFRGEV